MSSVDIHMADSIITEAEVRSVAGFAQGGGVFAQSSTVHMTNTQLSRIVVHSAQRNAVGGGMLLISETKLTAANISIKDVLVTSESSRSFASGGGVASQEMCDTLAHASAEAGCRRASPSSC